jgi:hypothetical protein
MSPLFQSQTLNRSTIFYEKLYSSRSVFVYSKFKLENHTYVRLRWGSANTQKYQNKKNLENLEIQKQMHNPWQSLLITFILLMCYLFIYSFIYLFIYLFITWLPVLRKLMQGS